MRTIDAFSAAWVLSFVRDRVELCGVGGACQGGKVAVVCSRMERVRVGRRWVVRAGRVGRWVGDGGAVDWGEAWVVRV